MTTIPSHKSTIRAVLFDFFDVIRTDAYKSWLSVHNIPHEGDYFDASYQQDIGAINSQEFLERLSQLSGRQITRAELDISAEIDYDVIEIIKALKKNYKIAIISNSPSRLIREILADHDLERYFDEIVVSSEVGFIKPSPDIFNFTLNKLSITPHEAIFIDDNKQNTDAAEKIGIKGIQFISAPQLKNDLASEGLVLHG